METGIVNGTDFANRLIAHIDWIKTHICVNSDGVTLNGDYFIAKERIDTPAKLLGWIHHLSQKTWFTSMYTHILISKVCNEYGFEDACYLA